MKISCNILKKHIKDSNTIDWIKVWDKFTIRTAEVEGVEVKGNNFEGVVVGEIKTCIDHPESKKLHILTVDIGSEVLQIVCGAPNVRVGLKVALVTVGGRIDEFIIGKRPLVGVDSYGMCCSGRELGISEDHAGIIELPNDYVIGTPIKEYIKTIDDIIVEIDNKSLTNRPDLWGHYGIAREIAAITDHELLPLDLSEIVNDKSDLDIKILNPEICSRYIGLKIDNISDVETPLDMKIFLHYVGMRSISLLVDLTNYLMLELGQPMHAFDSRSVKNIEIGLSNDGDTFTTLDEVKRSLTKEDLMIKNGNEYFAVAGVMGGLDSEILPDTNSIILESACFDAGSVRKTASRLNLRTEASARYEKSLDPNLTEIATKRFVYLLSSIDKGIKVASNMTDVYPSVLSEKVIELKKSEIKRNFGKDLASDVVNKIFSSLEFKVEELEDKYVVTVPTFRASKDISISADLIEELSRMYGYENFEITPLNLDLTFTIHEDIYDQEYEVKNYLASGFKMNEVHSYMWYKSALLKDLGILKDSVKLCGKNEDNILRDDLCLSLLDIVANNFKYTSNVRIFEIGTVIKRDENNRSLGIILGDDSNKVSELYNEVKLIISNLFNSIKNYDVKFIKSSTEDYYLDDYAYNVVVNEKVIGQINIVHPKIINSITKKKSVVVCEIDFNKFVELSKNNILYKEVSKYPEVSLDYTIITNSDTKYADIDNVLSLYEKDIILNYSLVDVFEKDDEKKYTIRYIVGSDTKTLTQEELEDFKTKFIEHIKKNGYSIVE